jgi:hypothetical protein
VTFRYREDPTGTLQYGLVAEEVKRVYPELVTYGADGQIESVRYTMLTSMLLNELQKQNRENQRQVKQIKMLSAQMTAQETENERRTAELSRRQAEQIKRLYAQVTEEKASRKREIEALQNSFAQRLAVLEQAMGKPSDGKLAAAFDK